MHAGVIIAITDFEPGLDILSISFVSFSFFYILRLLLLEDDNTVSFSVHVILSLSYYRIQNAYKKSHITVPPLHITIPCCYLVILMIYQSLLTVKRKIN